jgi:hypothetical protein
MYCSLILLYVFTAYCVTIDWCLCLTSWIILINAYKIKVVLTKLGLTYCNFLIAKKYLRLVLLQNSIYYVNCPITVYVFHNYILFQFIKTKLIKKREQISTIMFF